MSKSKLHGVTVGLGLCLMGLASFWGAPSIPGQEPTNRAVGLPERADSRVVPAPADSDTADEESGDTSLPDRAEVEALLKAAEEAADPDDADARTLVDLYTEALSLFRPSC